MNADSETTEGPYDSIAILGGGAIATGLAAVASGSAGRILMVTRSPESAERATALLEQACQKCKVADRSRITVLAGEPVDREAGLVIEAIAEDFEAKVEILGSAGELAPEADLATTTSSLSVTGIARAAGHPDRLAGLHVFNPVWKMELVELCLPEGIGAEVGERMERWCHAVGKTPVRVPDTTGFVVNRLLFPYLFEAVRLRERTGMTPEDVDRCMTLGLSYPLGPLALLDLVGLDVSVAIGQALNADTGDESHLAPPVVIEMVERGDLGRKSGRGFYDYG